MPRRIIAILTICALWACKTTPEDSSLTKDLADGSSWCHLRLQSTDNTRVSIDYQVLSDYQAGQHEAKPMWINVERQGLGSSDSVHFVVIEKVRENGQEREDTIKKIDLNWSANENKFTGEVPNGMVLQTKNKQITGHEFAFRVNSDWQKDPVSGQNNFKSNLSDINKMNNYTCRHPNSSAPTGLTVKNWRALPTQQEIDDLTSKPMNDPAHPYTDYRPDAPGASMDLPGEAILAAMRRSKDKFKTGMGEPSYGNMTGCLFTGYSPTHWPDIAIHYYCLMNEPRYCYTYSTSAKVSRVDSFKGCTGNWTGQGSFPYPQYVPGFEFVKNDQPIEFQYVMFGQTNAFKADQEQAIINTFWCVQNPYDRMSAIRRDLVAAKTRPTDHTAAPTKS
jgi:hypothetical protein